MTTSTFRQVLQANLLAIISVLIAVASLSYNTWRNDVSELNRNQRAAGFAVLQELATLQLLATVGITHAQQGLVLQEFDLKGGRASYSSATSPA